ncbi:DUF4150 domain-containing protein [Agrobacterium rosae]|uniref:DUF4150 domain-containing protein n=1 Tax=Agrobacterium rosae TaxID=1972867 RepID=UPI00122F624B|nr:DUF4150 domain-containing protein [Agrobacterium rosae]KAA3508937.1 DUF4150 domain-containing protein [Agrobacterium rosae]KAA3513512.1 DUF4150 domain-containing protein [Agrobacterium rosae]MQB51071.1 DUF4150 domain-containing protein [Agrobacterium rosae]
MSIPRDYAGEPQYPEPWTTNKPREGLRDIDEARIVSLAPDVCLTPVGSSVVPIPYPVVDFCGHDKNYTPSVRFTRKKAMVMRSCTTHVHGDAPGIRKGRKSGTVDNICEPIGHADQVRAEGSNVIRHLDRFYMNNKNTEGEAIFVRSTQTYGPPKDDDPVPGSLRSNGGDEEGRVVSDASSEPLIEGEQYAIASGATAAAKSSPQVATTTRGGALPKPTAPTVPRGPGEVIRPGPGRAPLWHRPPMPAKVAESLGQRALPWLGRLGKFGARFLGTAVAVLWPSELGAPISERLGGGLFPRDEEEFDIVRTAEEAVRTGRLKLDEGVQWSRDAITQYRQRLDDDNERAREEVEKNPRLGAALDHNVRVDTKDRKKWPCVVGPYKWVETICPGEAHHIIPDMVYRLGKAPKLEPDRNSNANRIPYSPTYNEGQAICLSPGMHRTDDDAVHKSLNPALKLLGERHVPNGTAPLGEIRAATHQAINMISNLPEKCKKLARDAATVQVGSKSRQPGRTTRLPPKDADAIRVLSGGSYAR